MKLFRVKITFTTSDAIENGEVKGEYKVIKCQEGKGRMAATVSTCDDIDNMPKGEVIKNISSDFVNYDDCGIKAAWQDIVKKIEDTLN